MLRCFVVVPAFALLSLLHGAPASAESVRLHDTVSLDGGPCTLTITSGTFTLCEGVAGTASAELVCGEGFGAHHLPQWSIDGSPIGNGLTVEIPPLAPGSHVLAASCGSCQDEVDVEVLPLASCGVRAEADALFSDDATENTTGVFLQVNPEPVTPASFSFQRYRMRPLSLSIQIAETGAMEPVDLVLDLAGGSGTAAAVEIYREDGSSMSLPDTLPYSSLPATVYLNAAGAGERLLIASVHAPAAGSVAADSVRLRAGPFPGLAGKKLPAYPHFEFIDAVNDIDTVRAALDPVRHAERLGLPFRAYVVAHRTPAEWAADGALIDVSGGFETAVVQPGSISDNTLALWNDHPEGGNEGTGYDVIFDFGLDGALDPGDLIDGLDARLPGVTVVPDLTAPGPHSVVEAMYSGGEWLYQDTYYPADIAALGKLPLVVISHGYGHHYTWYDYLGYHLASHGYVVMSHSNNIGPGIEAASQTTIDNIDYIIGHQSVIEGGVLNGHIDGDRIVSIGHSRGGEGVLRAYTRVYEGLFTPQYYDAADIVALSSIAPVVYLSPAQSNPHEVNYQLIWGAADGDVSGAPDCAVCQSFRHPEWAKGNTIVTYIQGADHEDFNCCGWDDGQGPDQIGRPETQRLAKGYYLALAELYARDRLAMKEFFTRMFDDFHPSGIAPNVVSCNQYRDGMAAGNEIIDDYQSNPALDVSSSGGAVTWSVQNVYEGQLDGNSDFSWTGDVMNGMTEAEGTPDTDGVVFEWWPGSASYYEFEIIPPLRDFSDDAFLSLRAAQGTRHPQTVLLNGPLDFTVTLRDGAGVTGSVNFGVYGRLTEPYQRTGAGAGAGWQNEFHTVRIPIPAFETDGSGIDLTDIRAVRLDFGTPFGSERGRIGLDDVMLVKERP